ncbi:VCBS repeat-containing protein [Flavicella sp.]|uniref:VCBS repeat-containing protein n=1 Tax=Flavicella sp. TaxID=2957742 RepID=UPI003019A929
MKIYTLWFFMMLLFLAGCDSKPEQNSMAFKPTLFNSIKSEDSGIYFSNDITEDLDNFFMVYNYAYNGGGVAIGDINNDGLPDIYFTGNQVSNKLYLNKGDFKFDDITDTSKVSGEKGWSNGVVMVDINGDDLLDIYVCKGGWKGTTSERSNLLYINNGDTTFSEKAKEYGLADTGFSMMASFFDMDNDNDLDMYLVNRPQKFNSTHESIRKGKAEQNQLYRHKLYENINGHFIEVGLKSGIDNTYAFGLGLVTSDLDNDGFVDVYVANDYLESDYFFKNQGDKKFRQDIAGFSNHVSFYGMGVDVVDFNNDGFEDLIELDMTPSDHERAKVNMATMDVVAYKRILDQGNHYQYMHNMLQINNGNGFFSEVSQLAGIAKTDWSWSCLGSDFDNDGFRDLFISNGFRRDVFDKDITKEFTEYVQSKEKQKRSKLENVQYIVNFFKENKLPNQIYKNMGNLKFVSKMKEWGLEDLSFSNGASVADLDNDGDLDLVVNNINDKAFIYRNNAEKIANNYIKIKLKGPKGNTYGLGAKVTVYHKDSIQYHELKNVRGYLSSVDPIVHFGLGNILQLDSVKVYWPDGKISMNYSIQSNKTLEVEYKKAKRSLGLSIKSYVPMFKDITEKAFENQNIKHQENDYDDFRDQILLPHKLSTEGPCIAVADVNNDGYEDFFIGGATGQSGKLFLQNKDKTFSEFFLPVLKKDKGYEDTASVFFDADNDGDFDLYVVSGGNEFAENSMAYQDRLYWNDGKGGFAKEKKLPLTNTSGGTVIPLDFDGDGDLDLFIGGRLVPKKYPKAPRSFLLENKNGIFINVTRKLAPELEYLGMITDATFVDINKDGEKELLVVGEWMPVVVFEKLDGVYRKKEIEGLEKTEGWWNCISPVDLDMDGDFDFVLGNLGLNYKFKASKEKPFYVFASDYDSNGSNDVFLAKNYKNKIVPIRGKECSTQQLPGLSKKFKSYGQFAKADLSELLGDVNNSQEKREAYVFESVSIMNNSGVFEIKPLPNRAQFSTVQSLLIDDFTGDGVVDVFAVGNKFNIEIETTRADASIGVLLEGDTLGGLSALSALQSGVFLPQNVKCLQSICLGKNGKGVLVGVNNGELRLLEFKTVAR